MTPAEFEMFWRTFQSMGVAKQAPFAGRWYLGRHEIRDMITLKKSGYKPEPEHMSQPMSWYWRRPIRPGTRDTKGQRFQSTSQAISDLRRQEAERMKDQPVREWRVWVNAGGERHLGMLPARGFLEAQRMADGFGGEVIDDDPQELPLSEGRPIESSTSHVPDPVQ